ncbi:hypothetical protein AnigIFM63604_003313 [Aspergillus niger]|uniref:Uncharacterized protein n=1 Tax=Aspergillus niger TaxID=5061 RepID=A0A9W6ABH3_ASPNG|nr:hypothetical protein AnigIFM63604_003313 [Aspergillus niger]
MLMETSAQLPADAPQTSNVNTLYDSSKFSTILPPIRDLQSLPGIDMDVSRGALPLMRDVARSDSFSPTSYWKTVVSSHSDLPSTIGERQAADCHVTSGKPPLMHDWAPFPYTGMTYLSGASAVPHAQESAKLWQT